jgi:hypothetical protein
LDIEAVHVLALGEPDCLSDLDRLGERLNKLTTSLVSVSPKEDLREAGDEAREVAGEVLDPRNPHRSETEGPESDTVKLTLCDMQNAVSTANCSDVIHSRRISRQRDVFGIATL